MNKIKFIKDTELKKRGEIVSCSKKSAESAVSQGYAEYVDEPKLNWDQNKAIELESKKKLPELSKELKKQGRQKQTEKSIKKIEKETSDKENKEKEVVNKEELKKYKELQKKYEVDKIKEDERFLFTRFDKFTDFLTIAELFIKDQPVYYDKSKIWWLWNNLNKKWERVDEVDLMNAIDYYTRNPSANAIIKNEILESLKRIGRKNKPEEPKKSWVQFKDTIYDVVNNYKFEATPKYFITNPIPWDVGKSEETPIMDSIFNEWVYKKGIQDESYVKTLYEIMSYCLITYIPIHRIFCFIGNGLNGKGSFLRLIEKLVGDDNKCATEIELLATHRFETSKLYKKLVCIVGEIDKGIFRKTKTIKSLSGDDLIRFEFKGKDGFDDHNYAKPLVATNNLPETSDKTKGFYRRWTIVDFPNEFTEVKDIIEDIPNEEIENFCKKAIRIIPKLLSNGEFTNDGTIDEREDKYEKHSNYINEFVKTYCIYNPDSYVEFADFSEKYNEYLISEGMKKKSKIEIGRSINLKGFEKKVKKVSTGFDNTTKMCILGIKFKEEYL